MKIKKSLLSLCLSISCIVGCFVPCIGVNAVTLWTPLQNKTYFNDHFYKIEDKLDGINWNIQDLQDDFYDYLDDHKSTYNIPSGTSGYDWIGDQISCDGVTIDFSEGLRSSLRAWGQSYIDQTTGFKYLYSMNSGYYVSMFNETQRLNAFLDFINSHQSDLLIFDTNNYHFEIVDADGFVYKSNSNGWYVVRLYKNGSYPIHWEEWQYDYVNGVYYKSNDNQADEKTSYLRSDPRLSLPNGASPRIVALNSTKYIVYNTLTALQNGSNGIQSYYTNNNYGNTISGSYNTSISNIDNSITSTEINQYINNYYDDNGKYPTPQEITIYINNYVPDPDPTPTPTPGPGGGGDNPGGGGDDNDVNIWDFLHEIGEILGNLISTLGEVVAGLLSAISNIVSSLITSFPNVIGSLIEYFLPFLPEELITVISLSIILSIIVGIVKLIRG